MKFKRVNNSKIASTAKIDPSAVIECDYLELGEHSYIGQYLGVGFTFDFLKEESSQDVFRESYLPLFIVSPSVSSYPILFIVSPSVYPILLCAF